MGVIERYWNDDAIYHVEFITINDRRISKVLVFDFEYTLDEVRKIVLSKFNNVVEIVHIDLWDNCLSLKNRRKVL